MLAYAPDFASLEGIHILAHGFLFVLRLRQMRPEFCGLGEQRQCRCDPSSPTPMT